MNKFRFLMGHCIFSHLIWKLKVSHISSVIINILAIKREPSFLKYMLEMARHREIQTPNISENIHVIVIYI